MLQMKSPTHYSKRYPGFEKVSKSTSIDSWKWFAKKGNVAVTKASPRDSYVKMDNSFYSNNI